MNDKFLKILPLIGIVLVVIILFATKKPEPTNQDLKKVISEQNKGSSNSNPVESNKLESNQNMQKTKMPLPSQIIDTNKTYFAQIETSQGKFKVKLYAKEAPLTVNNFVYLANSKYFDGLIFHRVIKDFMIQGGDPIGNGTGGPGYSFPDEQSGKKLVKGSLAMANAGPNTNGSQFFIVTAESTPWLDGKHTNFGEVIEGMDVVNKIGNTKTGNGDRPVENIVIKKVEISSQ